MATMDLSWNDVRRGVAKLCEERGWHHGVPMMSSTDTGRRIILAKGCPLSDTKGHDVPVSMTGEPQVHVCTAKDVDDTEMGPIVVNAWNNKPTIVAVVQQKGKYRVTKIDASKDRLNMLMNTIICQAGSVDSDAELKAMMTLKGKINDNQWDAYLLGGAFPETSKRSGVTYILRKGLPTIALRCIPKPEGGEDRHFLAALCSHPLAWWEGTHVGAYPPTDEVIAHLLLIRSDEHDLWKRSGQHGLNEVQAGI